MMTMNFLDVIGAAKREAKGEATPDEAAWLHQPGNFPQWAAALRAAIQDASEQMEQHTGRLDRFRRDAEAGLMSKQDYISAREEFDAWERKATRYRLGLEQRLHEIEAADKVEAARLRDAILRHRESMLDEATDEDVALWAAIEAD